MLGLIAHDSQNIIDGAEEKQRGEETADQPATLPNNDVPVGLEPSGNGDGGGLGAGGDLEDHGNLSDVQLDT